MRTPNNTNEYIAAFPKDTQLILEKLRAVIKKAAPTATEKISYAMPTFYLDGNLVHFAAYEYHIGFYPAPSAIIAFETALSSYKTSKGAIQFPIDQPLPIALITKIVQFRVKENLAKANLKTKKKK
jgi:uncharacterized protein YdhG (YjbR/CyaY superfamily)